MKTMVRPSRWAFFERRPRVPLPAGDLGLVALDGLLLRLLVGEAHAPKQVPQMAGAVLDPEALGDELAQCALLFSIQLAGPSQVTALEIFPAAFYKPLFPTSHRLPRPPQLPCHFRFRQHACKKLRPFQPTFLQRLEIPLLLHPCTLF